jgi:hypothetical protein
VRWAWTLCNAGMPWSAPWDRSLMAGGRVKGTGHRHDAFFLCNRSSPFSQWWAFPSARRSGQGRRFFSAAEGVSLTAPSTVGR